MSRPAFRLACCLCGKPIPLKSDVYALDGEWQRRFPAMTGTLACPRCAIDRNHFSCERRDGTFVPGHVPATWRPEEIPSDFDSWCHIDDHGTHAAMVTTYPEAGLLQGAEDYLRHVATRRGMDPEFTRRIQEALDRWDTLRAPATAGAAAAMPPAPDPSAGPSADPARRRGQS